MAPPMNSPNRSIMINISNTTLDSSNMTSSISRNFTLSEEGDEFGLYSVASQDLPNEGDIFSCVYSFFDLCVGEIGDKS